MSGIPLRRLGDYLQPVGKWNPHNAGHGRTFTYIDISAIDQQAKEIREPQAIPVEAAPSRARQIVCADDVLVSTVRPNLNAVASVPDHLDGVIASTGFTVLRPRVDNLDSRYLHHWVRSKDFVAYLVSRATGASYPAVSDGIVKDAFIPLPSIAEQRRIAAILDKADAIRRKRQQALALARFLLQSKFAAAFDEGKSKWGMVSLDEISSKITDGVHAKPEYTDHGVPFISVKDITSGTLTFDKCKYITKDSHVQYIRRCRPERGDILYTKVGATYGRPAIVDTDVEFSLYVSVALIKPIRALVEPLYLLNVMRNPFVKRQADASIKGIGVPDLHLIEIKKFQIPLPPMNVQQQLVEQAQAIESAIESAVVAVDHAEELLMSISQRAFKGML